MALKRHQKFWLENEKKWTEKWFKFVTLQDDWEWWSVSCSPNVTIKFIEANPELIPILIHNKKTQLPLS